MGSSSFKERFVPLLDSVPLSKFQKNVISNRYIVLAEHAHRDYNVMYYVYTVLSYIITFGSIIVAALVSLKELGWLNDAGRMSIFWITWGLSIAVAIASKYLYAFAVHKKYVLNTIILQKYYNEGWSFISNIGRYGKYDSYDDKFKLFCARIEKINAKSVESMPEAESKESTAILAVGTESPSPRGGLDDIDSLPSTHIRRTKNALSRFIRRNIVIDDGTIGTVSTVNTVNSTVNTLANTIDNSTDNIANDSPDIVIEIPQFDKKN